MSIKTTAKSTLQAKEEREMKLQDTMALRGINCTNKSGRGI